MERKNLLINSYGRTRAIPSFQAIRLPLSLYALTVVIVFLIGAAIYHILQQPYPNQWDDSVYAGVTYDWLDFMKSRDLVRGVFWGAVYAIPHHMPPVVYLTSLAGGLVTGGSLLGMRLAQLIWFVVMLLAVYGIGHKLVNAWAGVWSVVFVGTLPLIFFWGKMIMGEPSLFAAVALLLLLLIRWGNNLTLWRGAVIGGVIGFGLLTKQHYLISAVGPLGIWGLWLSYKFFHQQKKQRWNVVLSLLMVLVMALVTAGPWFVLSWDEAVAYAIGGPEFTPHTLGSAVSWYTISTYLGILFSQLGLPAVFLITVGLIWTSWQLFQAGKAIFYDWQPVGLLLLFVSGLIGFIVVIKLRNLNTRFVAPVLIPWGILAALALIDLWQRRQVVGRAIVAAGIALHLVFWWSISFGPALPSAVTVFAQDPDFRPANIELMLNTFEVLETNLLPASQDTVWVVGNYHSFNMATIANLVTERGYGWNVQELYAWNETETNVAAILDRAKPGDWIALYQRDQHFKADVEKVFGQYDADLLRLLQGDSSFDLVYQQKTAVDTDQVWLYRRTQGEHQILNTGE